MKISACMIAKNEEKMLLKTMPPLAEAVDEIIFVDTGSYDNSIEIAKKHNAKICSFPWINDFSAARNESLKHPTGDWVIWIDADECVKAEDFIKLRKMLEETSENCFAIPVYECPVGSFEPASFYYRVKIFRNKRGVHFKRPFNEQMCDANGNTLSGTAIKEVSFYHWGNFKEGADKEQKKNRNISMLKKLTLQQPDDIDYHFLLGNDLRETKSYKEAIVEYDAVIALDSKKRLAPYAYAFSSMCHLFLGKAKEAYINSQEALKLDPDNCWALNTFGILCISQNLLDEAIKFLSHSALVETPNTAGWVYFSPQQRDYVANYYLGDAYLKNGEKEKAKAAFEKACKAQATAAVQEKLKCL